MEINLFKQSMEVGYYFDKETNHKKDKRISDWHGSEECATFAKAIVDYANDNGCCISFAFYEIMDETITGIHDKSIKTEEHAWDEYAKGFLAGQIIGYPYEENMELVKIAEKLWENNETYGYYQEVLNDVKVQKGKV